MNPPHEPGSSHPGHIPYTPQMWVERVCQNTESFASLCRNVLCWSIRSVKSLGPTRTFLCKQQERDLGVWNQLRVGIPACRPIRQLWLRSFALLGTMVLCLLLSDSSHLQACDRKAGLELTPQLWLRTQEGSAAREAPCLSQTQETTQQHIREGRGDTGKKAFSNEA